MKLQGLTRIGRSKRVETIYSLQLSVYDLQLQFHRPRRQDQDIAVPSGQSRRDSTCRLFLQQLSYVPWGERESRLTLPANGYFNAYGNAARKDNHDYVVSPIPFSFTFLVVFPSLKAL